MTNSFTVYRSSAGSGKTFTLVKEYLKIILKEPGDFRYILAITFTNKAANEMRDRILAALDELSKEEPDGDTKSGGSLLAILAGETGMSAAAIRITASRAMEMILHNYADFSISTIDGFSHKLIRTFAHDFGLPVNFNVELDSDEMLSTAVDLLLDRVGDDQELTLLLVNFLETRMDEEKGWNIDTILAHFARILLDEEGQARIGKLKKYSLGHFRQISDSLYSSIRQFEKKVREIAAEAAGLIAKRDIPLAAFYQGDKGIGRYFQNLAAGRTDRFDPNSFVRKTIDEDKWHGGKTTPADRESIDAIKTGLAEAFHRLMHEFEQHKPDYLLRKLLAKTIYPLAVLNEIERVLGEFKRQSNIIHISEFNSRISEIVINEPVPFIYERLGEKYRHLFIDEFQDTSALQWMNYIPLIENALSGGFFNLVVGDGKQAIYRWRNGDVEQFNALPAIAGSRQNVILRQREQVLANHYRPKEINRNYRSKAGIIQFNNLFFRTISDTILIEGKDKVYVGLEQEFDQAGAGGYVRLEFLDPGSRNPTYEEQNLSRVLEIIRGGLEDNYRCRDMAVLCRSNRHASLVARHLLENGIDVVSAESLLVANSLKVRFIIACIRFLFEPPNDIVAEEIRRYAGDAGSHLFLKGRQSGEYSMMPLYDLCEALVREFGLNEVPDAYLQFFLDAVLKFTVKGSGGAVEFLRWWELNRLKVSIIVPEGLDAVNVMTIHKAKGLQFSVVILPFAHEGRKNTRSHLWVDLDPAVASGLETAILRSDREMEATVFRDLYADEQQKSMLDLLNLLYVAMTRPKERMYILTRTTSASKEGPDSWPRFFEHYLRKSELWTDDQVVYEFGSEEGHISKSSEPKVDVISLKEFINNDWRDKIQIKLRAPMSWEPDDPAAGPQFGNQLHTLLSWIKTGKDAPLALEKAVLSGLVEAGRLSEYSKLVDSVINDPRLSDFFREGVSVRTEPEILIPGGAFYRPDRVVLDGDRVTVIDYKSGRPREEHGEQLRQYSGCLSEMGYQDIRRILVYLTPEIELIEI